LERTGFKIQSARILGLSNMEVDDDIVFKLGCGQKISLPIPFYEDQFINLINKNKLVAIINIRAGEIDRIVRFL